MDTGHGPLVSRRAVAIGAAWTVPVIITAVAAPAASASTLPALAPSASMVHVKGSTYALTLTFPAGTSTVVSIISIVPESAGTSSGTFTWTPANQVAAPSAQFSVDRSGDNSAGVVDVTYTAGGGAPRTIPVTLTGI